MPFNPQHYAVPVVASPQERLPDQPSDPMWVNVRLLDTRTGVGQILGDVAVHPCVPPTAPASSKAFVPQQYPAPSVLIPHAVCPARTTLHDSLPDTRVGAALFVVVPLPSAPEPFEPQQYASYVVDTAQTWSAATSIDLKEIPP